MLFSYGSEMTTMGPMSVLSVIVYVALVAAKSRPSVRIDSGVWAGRDALNGAVDEYLGIKYADVHRFKPSTAFKGPVNANATDIKACPQFTVISPLAPPSSKSFDGPYAILMK